jgi:hypothetical protein
MGIRASNARCSVITSSRCTRFMRFMRFMRYRRVDAVAHARGAASAVPQPA